MPMSDKQVVPIILSIYIQNCYRTLQTICQIQLQKVHLMPFDTKPSTRFPQRKKGNIWSILNQRYIKNSNKIVLTIK